ncbi:fibulin-2 [Takifugu rubripes]|uniref:Fibulin 2 n=1 Tax=Takifugu rubripes TaxID=31033 RepID=A0A674MWA5_TAKRU|nr:fibulin-2 [Takifugu rubripes]XP_011600873.2 fibulin-2 [Takifugu rubripes]XP_029689909.1 fibulin-2 [Takifugu rubripes]
MNFQRAALVLCWTLLFMDSCLSQRDCTGVDCPLMDNCLETTLEVGACCPTCTQRGCTCEGYQYYDCVLAGFQKGKVPEGESYFVDFGSTECSCPQGGGKIICHFIPCPELPTNCIDILQPADGCMQCERIGCAHGNKKYEAGHSFQMDECQVCHCPNEGGKLMCSLVPECDLHSGNKPVRAATTEDNRRFREINSRPVTSQTHPMEPYSKLALGNTLPLFKQDPPGLGTTNYDNILAGLTSSAVQKLAQSLESTTVPAAYPESSSTSFSSHDEQRHELREPEETREAVVTQDMGPTTTEVQSEPTTVLTTTQEVTTENLGQKKEVGERPLKHEDTNVLQDPLKDLLHTTPPKHQKPSQATHSRSHASFQSVVDEKETVSVELREHPKLQFSPTSHAPVRIKEERQDSQPQNTPQSHNYQVPGGDGVTEVSAKELVQTCCETGEKWASSNGHCNDMEPPAMDRHSICWTAQRQCCVGSLGEQQCLAGINAARGGEACPKNVSDKCGTDSYKECCDCCFLGLQLRAEGRRCEPHSYLGFHCRHVFLSCCEEEESGHEESYSAVRERPTFTSSPPLQKVSDSPFPREAFSIGEEQDGGNAVDGPIEVDDMDKCQLYAGNSCHHRCVNTPSSFRCECFPGYVLQEDAFTCVPEAAEEDNRLKETEGAAVEPTSPLPPPTEPPAPADPCEGNGPCQQQCTSVGGRPHCSCFPGFSLMTDGLSCADVNECSSARACQPNQRCVNTVGNYVCQRPISCPPGYQLNNDICEDINECAQQSHNCGQDECVNTVGSFRCNSKPRCQLGFNRDAQGNCIDTDECGASTQPCSPAFNCINTVGSYTCQRKLVCSRGYHAGPDGSRCVDVDECQSGAHRCGDGQMCHNLPGSYRCECQTGYEYDSFRRTCVDINECWRYSGRLCAQTCENTPGSYECSCTSGFRLSSDGKNCEDVNECLASPCSQECANIYGSYQCYCRQGYFLRQDGHTCDDIDECSQSIGHLCTYKCENVPGSYQCACPEYGYTMSANGRSCKDIDECTTGAHNCSLAETCYNIQGGYRCLSLNCPPNYRKVSDTRCERISCPNYLDCQNSPLRITYYYLSFQSNIVIPAQIFRIGPSPAYSGDNVIISITQGNEDNYFSTRKLNAYTGAVYLQRQVEGPRDFLVNVEMKLWRQGTFTTFHARIYVFITGNSM